VKAISKMSPNL